MTINSRPRPSEEIAASGKTEAQNPESKVASGFPVVGIGASAGGLAAFEAFFSAMPADIGSDMALA